MGFKVSCVLVSAMIIQIIAGQCLQRPYPTVYPKEIAAANVAAEALTYPAFNPITTSALAIEPTIGPGISGLTVGLSLAELSASNGHGLRVNSASPMASTGVSVETDKMVIEGPLTVTGQLPFLGAVALEGPLAATGTGSVAYECGNGNVGIVSEGVEPVVNPAYPNMPLAQAYPDNLRLPQGYPNMELAQGYPNMQLAQGYPNMQIAQGYPNMQLGQGNPDTQIAQGYPNMQLAQGYPNMQLAQGYPNMQLTQGYPNMQLAPGYRNAGIGPFANGIAPGFASIPQE